MRDHSITSRSSSISGTTSFRIAHLARAHRKLADALLGEIGLHVGQEMVMNALWEAEPISQSALAERLRIQPATLTVALRSLERAGYIVRQRDTDDQRVVRVSSTRKGIELQDGVTEVWRKLEERTLAGLSTEEKVAFDALLHRVNGNLSGE